MKKLLTLMSCLAVLVSCVDQDYDLEKISTDDATLNWETIQIPVGNLETIKVGDLIGVEGNEYIKISEAGDYSIHLDGTTGETTYTAPNFNLKASGSDETERTTVYSPAMVSGNSSIISIAMKNAINLHETSIPAELVKIENVKIDAAVACRFSFRSEGGYLNAIMLAAGTSIEFPSWITLGEYDTKLFSKSGNTLTLISDQRLTSSGLDFTCKATAMDFTKLPAGQGLVGKGEVYVCDSLQIKGGIFVKEADVTTKAASDRCTLKFTTSLSDARAISATAVVKPEITMGFSSINTEALATTFSEDSNLDIYDMCVSLAVNNETPLEASIDADLDAYKAGVKNSTAHFGPLGIKPSATTSFTLGSRTGTKVEGLTDVIACLPDKIQISGFKLTPSETPSEFTAGSKYSVSADYSVDAPLAFGKNLNIAFDSDINVGLSLEDSKIGSVLVSFTAENTIPLGMEVSAEVLGNGGAAVRGSSIKVEGAVSAGKLGAASSDKLQITIVPGDNMTTLDTVKLHFKATCDEAHEGVSLNSEQGLTIKGISLKVNDIKIKL